MVPVADRVHPGGLAALRAAGGRVLGVGDPVAGAAPDVLLDGIVGIGGRPGLRPLARQALAAWPQVPVVAVDVPSGVDVDTGAVPADPDDHVRAVLTVTFGTHKVAHLADPAALACGQVRLVDLGLDLGQAAEPAAQAWDAEDVRAALARIRPAPDAHKYTRGVVGVRTGSARYPGAAVLGVGGAACGAAGMVRYSGGAAEAVLAAYPEVVAGPGRVQALVVGSGGDTEAADALADALAARVPVVVDADALDALDPDRDLTATGPVLATPHAGELARMLQVDREQIEAEPWVYARRAAQEYRAVVLLKGRRSVIAAPDRPVRITTAGVPWLATAGSGDVLAGLLGALLAAGLDPFDAATAGSWLHEEAGARANRGGPLRAGDLVAALPVLLGGLLGEVDGGN